MIPAKQLIFFFFSTPPFSPISNVPFFLRQKKNYFYYLTVPYVYAYTFNRDRRRTRPYQNFSYPPHFLPGNPVENWKTQPSHGRFITYAYDPALHRTRNSIMLTDIFQYTSRPWRNRGPRLSTFSPGINWVPFSLYGRIFRFRAGPSRLTYIFLKYRHLGGRGAK